MFGIQKIYSRANYLTIRNKSRLSKFFDTIHLPVPFATRPDLFHFFDRLSLGKTPWVVTFSTAVPRWNTSSRLGWQLIKRDACRALVPISKNSRDIQLQIADQVNAREVESKIQVLYPPQPILQKPHAGIEKKEKITFTLVGALFFLKGGMEILEAFDAIPQSADECVLNIVSPLDIGDHASRATEESKVSALRLIEKNKAYVRHYHNLPNARVLELLKQSDVGLLPTYADTFGYSLLESQACGCPGITTNVRALPEINNEKCGWIIDVPKDELGHAFFSSRAERENLSKTIKEQLIAILQEIFNNRSAVTEKARHAQSLLQQQNDPKTHAEKLSNIYENALSLI